MLRDTMTGAIEFVSASALFVLIGAEHTQAGCLPVFSATLAASCSPAATFVATICLTAGRCNVHRPLQTSLPGVFAAGDVRQRSVKRVASAVGEGSIAATNMSQYLQEPDRPFQ